MVMVGIIMIGKKKVELWMVMEVMIIPLDGHGGDDHNWKKR